MRGGHNGYQMKILSYNVRGLGKWMKRKFIKNLILNEGVQFVSIQETKKENTNKELCHAIWGDTKVEWIA